MSDRRYEKPAPIKEDVLIEPQEARPAEVPADEVLAPVPATPYSKAENVVQPEAFVVVFSNGEVRERMYFHWMMHHCERLRLEFFSDPISPDDLLKDVKAKKAEYDLTAAEEMPDTYYTVTDVDHFYNDILRSKAGYENEGINLIISNPCFEVWLYYSKRDDKFEGFEMPEDRLKLSQKVKQFLNDKIPGGVNPAKAVFDIKANIVNARKNYGEDVKGIPVQFATNMFVLAEDVLPYVEAEIEAWKEKQTAEHRLK